MSQREDVPDPANGAWHLDKRVPLALIVALFVQTVGMVWWVSDMVHRLDAAITVNDRQDSRITTIEATTNAQAVSNATMTAEISAVRESLQELKNAQAETNRLLRELSRGNQ